MKNGELSEFTKTAEKGDYVAATMGTVGTGLIGGAIGGKRRATKAVEDIYMKGLGHYLNPVPPGGPSSVKETMRHVGQHYKATEGIHREWMKGFKKGLKPSDHKLK